MPQLIYALQAAIAACHMRACTAEETDWDRIVLLYDALLQINPSPIVALNRAVAVSMVQAQPQDSTHSTQPQISPVTLR